VYLRTYLGTYDSTIVYESWLCIRLVQPELVFDLPGPIDRVGHNIRCRQTLRFVAKHDELISVRIVFWVCRERLGLYLTERVVASGLQRAWVNCVRL
jgi:hypothetical protein